MNKENEINEQTVNALCGQAFYAGFGSLTRPQIKDALANAVKNGNTEFEMVQNETIKKDSVRGVLYFKQSQNDPEKWFTNSFTLLVKKEGKEETLQQRFPTYYGNQYTFTEGYNLMSGRSALKKFIQVDKQNPKYSREYEAWTYLDFKSVDENNNFKIEKVFDYNLEKKLAEIKIMGMDTSKGKKDLMDGLSVGGIMPVSVKTSRGLDKMFVEASPCFDSLKFYDEKMKPMRVSVNDQSQSQGQEVSNKTNQTQNEQNSMANKTERKAEAKQTEQPETRKRGSRIKA